MYTSEEAPSRISQKSESSQGKVLENSMRNRLTTCQRIRYNHNADATIVCDAPRSSSGQGRRPFKAEITGSNPVRGILLPTGNNYVF